MLCRIASGKSKGKQILTAGIRYVVLDIKLRICCKLSMLVAYWLANAAFVTAARDRFLGEEDAKPLFVSFIGPSIKKQWRELQEAQLCCFCHLECPKNRRWGGDGFGQRVLLKAS